MPKNFDEFKFQVIDINNNTGDIKMVLNKNSVFFSPAVLETLGRPEYVKPLLDIENKVFALQVTKATMTQSMKIANSKTKSGGSYTSTCTVIRKTLRKLMGDAWNDEMRYEITGIDFPSAKAVVFELEKAKELPPGFSSIKKHKEKIL